MPKSKEERAMIRTQCECEIVETKAIIYFQTDDEGKVSIKDMVIPRDEAYENLIDALAAGEEHDNCEAECPSWELNDAIEEWLEENHSGWRDYYGDEMFFCYICKSVMECYGSKFKDDDLMTVLNREYPPDDWENDGRPIAATIIKNDEAEERVVKKDDKPFSVFIEVGGGEDGKAGKKSKAKGKAAPKGKTKRPAS